MNVYCLTAILFLIFVQNGNCQSCKQLLSSTDECLRKILYIGDNDMVFVKTEQQLNEHCKEIKESYKCLLKYGKCLRLFPKQVFTISMRSAKKLVKDRCDVQSGRKEFLKHTRCLRKPELYDFNRCVDKGVLEMKLVSRNATETELIPSMCCAFHDIMDCLKRKGDEHCDNYTGKGTGDYVSGIARTFAKDLIELACGERTSLQKCHKLEPKWMNAFAKIGVPFESIKPQKNSFLTPLLNIAKKLDKPL